jgi:ABC-type polysaccharide/polyol phosphate transport system ATPase subunit
VSALGTPPVVELRGVSKSFRIPSVRRDTVRQHLLGLLRPRTFETLRVLDGIDLSVRAGETLGVMGRNGSGKSTMLKILCGIYRPDGGTVAVRAPVTPILELGVGWNPELDAVDNILVLGTVMGLTLREARAAVEGVLEFAGLARFARLQLKHFSSGMAARLAYAVAFTAARGILVLDEIFAVGDAAFKARCEARQRELSVAGHTVILVSHDPRAVSVFCPRAVLLEGGRVVMTDTGERVADAYLRLLAQPPAALRAVSGQG